MTQHITLDFSALGARYCKAAKDEKAPIDNLSAAAWTGSHLWVASDETGSIERLAKNGRGFGAAKSFPLSPLFHELPRDKELDLEALAYDPDADALWVASSHARTRAATEHAKAATLLADEEFKLKRRRCLLATIALADGKPQADGCAALPLGEDKGSLRHAIGKLGGPLARSLAAPAKENGLDVEALAAKGSTVLVGLRGPTVGGCAVVLRLSVARTGTALALREPPGVRLLPLHGLGVRDLAVTGNDVLVLAGPTFDLDAPFKLYRWPNAFRGSAARATVPTGLEYLADLTRPSVVDDSGALKRSERPEALAAIGRELLVLNDNPDAVVRAKPAVVRAEMLSLGRARPA